ncbi:hypothetical protein BC831DRAFT_115836 [Entophlyctis helioformis]|nr:hypothetical protein BC831DRAFT_115836 [Entophlyctis helioformis]
MDGWWLTCVSQLAAIGAALWSGTCMHLAGAAPSGCLSVPCLCGAQTCKTLAVAPCPWLLDGWLLGCLLVVSLLGCLLGCLLACQVHLFISSYDGHHHMTVISPCGVLNSNRNRNLQWWLSCNSPQDLLGNRCCNFPQESQDMPCLPCDCSPQELLGNQCSGIAGHHLSIYPSILRLSGCSLFIC